MRISFHVTVRDLCLEIDLENNGMILVDLLDETKGPFTFHDRTD